jgi:LemA protein
MQALRIAVILFSGLLFGGCGYNTLQQQDEQVTAAWSEVLNQYQRRADLVPNLVNTVKGAVTSEKEILDSVVEARAKATSIQATPELINNPQAFQQWQAAQGELSSALARLMVVVERYPDLKSISGFNDLRAQLEGTENRIAVARKRYIDAVQAYNITVRSFPTNLTAKMFGHGVKPNFTVEDQSLIMKPPAVDFSQAPPAGQQAPPAGQQAPPAGQQAPPAGQQTPPVEQPERPRG